MVPYIGRLHTHQGSVSRLIQEFDADSNQVQQRILWSRVWQVILGTSPARAPTSAITDQKFFNRTGYTLRFWGDLLILPAPDGTVLPKAVVAVLLPVVLELECIYSADLQAGPQPGPRGLQWCSNEYLEVSRNSSRVFTYMIPSSAQQPRSCAAVAAPKKIPGGLAPWAWHALLVVQLMHAGYSVPY